MASIVMNYHFDDDILEDILGLVGHAQNLSQVVAVAAEAPLGSSFSTISQHVAEKLKLSTPEVEQILATLQNICRTQTRTRTTPGQITELFARNIETYAKAKARPDILDAWQAASGTILQAINSLGPDHPLNIARKTERVYYSHQNLLTEVRVITDLRPVFDRSGDKIVRVMVAHSLLIEYLEGSVPHRLEIGLDHSELTDLRQACDRAVLKAVTLKESLKDKPWSTTLGLDDNDRMDSDEKQK